MIDYYCHTEFLSIKMLPESKMMFYMLVIVTLLFQHNFLPGQPQRFHNSHLRLSEVR